MYVGEGLRVLHGEGGVVSEGRDQEYMIFLQYVDEFFHHDSHVCTFYRLANFI